MDEVEDPVCGVMLDPKYAIASKRFRGRKFYFCSQDCKEAFEEDTEAYVA